MVVNSVLFRPIPAGTFQHWQKTEWNTPPKTFWLFHLAGTTVTGLFRPETIQLPFLFPFFWPKQPHWESKEKKREGEEESILGALKRLSSYSSFDTSVSFSFTVIFQDQTGMPPAVVSLSLFSRSGFFLFFNLVYSLLSLQTLFIYLYCSLWFL